MLASASPASASIPSPATAGLQSIHLGTASEASYAQKMMWVDMVKAGIIDPVKVVRSALQNAASISGLMLTTETMVTDLDKDDKKKVIEGSVR
jgi:hypothetical protein